ncbi:MAG: acylphosphatase [Gemmatimonadota bacterium]|nr:acylphosphatase [Gemmatimonadota bacterium]
MVTRRVVLEGRVQGVGFRHFTVQAARDLGVRGTVRNRRDGAVEAILQADDGEAVESLVDRMREGPRAARVESVEVEPVEDPDRTYDRMSVVW